MSEIDTVHWEIVRVESSNLTVRYSYLGIAFDVPVNFNPNMPPETVLANIENGLPKGRFKFVPLDVKAALLGKKGTMPAPQELIDAIPPPLEPEPEPDPGPPLEDSVPTA